MPLLDPRANGAYRSAVVTVTLNRNTSVAGHGYYVLVPNLFNRHGPAPLIELCEHIGEEVRPALTAQLMPLIEAHTAERVLRDADAYLQNRLRGAGFILRSKAPELVCQEIYALLTV